MKLHARRSWRVAFALLALSPLAAAQVLHEFQGTDPHIEFGVGLARAGDVNADGFDDLVIGAPDFQAGAGRVEVRSGLDGSVFWSRIGDAEGDRLGQVVASAGDVDGDGLDDVLIAAPYASELASNGGAVWVLSGETGSELHAFQGDGWNHRLGWSLGAVGDWNDDGHDDFLIGAPRDGAGRVRIHSGLDGSVLLEVDGEAGDYSGWSACAVDDLTSDGVRELLVGEPYDDSQGHDRGRARLLSGEDGSELAVFDGESDDSFFGWSVSALGDLDGDGVGDFGVGTPFESSVAPSAGLVRVISGADLSVMSSVFGQEANQRLGSSFDGVGDLDGDGHDDWVLGMEGDDRVEFLSGLDGSLLHGITGVPQDGTGAAVAGVGDVDGDGWPDVAIDSPSWSQVGRVRVYSGAWGVFHMTSFCQSGGASASCPCGNDDPTRGCASSVGFGAYLTGAGSTAVSADDLSLYAYLLPPGRPALLFAGDVPVASGALVLGDGLRCAGGNVQRLGVRVPPGSGSASWGPGLVAQGAWSAGETRYLQVWYRDSSGPCGAGFNVSSGVEVRLIP